MDGINGRERKRTERNEDEWNAKCCNKAVMVTRRKLKKHCNYFVNKFRIKLDVI